MTVLSQSSCEACRIGAPKVDEAEARELLTQIPDWSLIEVEGIQQLQRQYKFKNFVAAMDFANQLADSLPLLSQPSSSPSWVLP